MNGHQAPPLLQILDANKRELFDAMRAYHESERGHKTDAMALLGALLAAAGAIFGALVLPDKPVAFAGPLAAITAVAVSFGAWLVVTSTNAKIDADHTVYRAFGAEYMRTCEALGLYDVGRYVPIGATPIKTARNIGQGLGYEASKRILVSIAFTLTAFAWLSFTFVVIGVCPRTNTCMAAAAAPAPGASAPART